MPLTTTIPYLGAKLISTAALLLITAVFSYLPFLIKNRVRRSGLIMSYCNCIAGGIVLGALLMHMVPEIMEQGHCHGGHSAEHAHHAFRVRSLDGSLGAFGEGLLGASHLEYHRGHGHKDDHDHAEHKPGHKHDKENGPEAKAATSQDKKTAKADHEHHHQGHDHGHPYPWGPLFAGIAFLVLFAIDRLFLTHSHCADAHPKPKQQETKQPACAHGHHHDHDHNHHHEQYSIQPDEEHGSCHEDDVIGGCHSDGINASSTKMQTFIFVLALSIHSFLEGLGLATKTTKASLVSFLISLFAHKWLEAFALGAGVAKACFSSMHSFLLIALYALLTPTGILLGLGLEAVASDKMSMFQQAFIRQALDGLALGSFLFVSCIEMIPSEFHKKNKHTPYKFILLTLGFVAMAIISAFHSH